MIQFVKLTEVIKNKIDSQLHPWWYSSSSADDDGDDDESIEEDSE